MNTATKTTGPARRRTAKPAPVTATAFALNAAALLSAAEAAKPRIPEGAVVLTREPKAKEGDAPRKPAAKAGDKPKEAGDGDAAELSNKQLTDRFKEIKAEVEQLSDKAEGEGRKLSADEQRTYDEKLSKLDALEDAQKRRVELAKRKIATGDYRRGEDTVAKVNEEADAVRELDAKEQAQQFNAYLATGERSPELLSITSGTSGGVLVPTSVANPHVVKRLANCIRVALAAYNYPTIQRTDYAKMVLPVLDDTDNVALDAVEGVVNDNAAGAQDQEPDITGLQLDGTKFVRSQPAWFTEISLGASFDVSAYVMPQLVKRIDLRQEQIWLAKMIAAVVAAGVRVVNTTAIDAVSYNDILRLEHAVDVSYRASMSFIASDEFVLAARGLEGNGRPLFEDTPSKDWMSQMHGKPVLTSGNVSGFGANNTVALAVSAEALKVLDAGRMRMARYEKFPLRPDQVGMELFQNGDFDFIRNGVAILKCPAA